VKTTSSRLVRREFAHQLSRIYRKPVVWSRSDDLVPSTSDQQALDQNTAALSSYCIISGSGAPLSVIKQYIEQRGAPE
jgi:putative transposase